MSMRSQRHLSAASALIVALTASASAATANDTVIHAGVLIDGSMKKPRSNVSIIIKDDRIVAIQGGFARPLGAAVVDMSKATVLPGLIEAHSHMGGAQDADDDRGRRRTDGDSFVNVIRNAYRNIETGFTSTRDLGTKNVDFKAIKYAIAKDRIVGPRIWASLEPLGPVGGHSDPFNSEGGSQDPVLREATLVRGPIDAREKVRDHILRGADVIKIMPSGGVGSLDDDPNHTVMTEDEVRAVVETAHALGRTVAAHAHGTEAIKMAIRAGVDSIEHATYIDEEGLKLAKEHGTFIDVNMLPAEKRLALAKTNPERFEPRRLAKGLIVWPYTYKTSARVYKSGVKMVMGTDQSALGEGANLAAGLRMLVEHAGMSPHEAIVAATGTAANLLGSKDVGVIEAGRYADIIAVNNDPLGNIRELESVQFVMKGGKIYKENGVMKPRP